MPVIHAFDESGIQRGPDGLARYQERPQSLLHMLRATVDRWKDMPFRVMFAWLDGRDAIQLSHVQTKVPINAARFNQSAPSN